MNKRPADDPAGTSHPNKLHRDNGAHDTGPRGIKRGGARYPVVSYREDVPLMALKDHWRAAADETGVLVEVTMSPECLSRENKRVKARQIWGDLVYTPDSDLVAVLMHLGYYAAHLAHPPNAVSEVRVLLRLVDASSRESFPSKTRFLKSRSWGKIESPFAYQVEKVWLITRTAVAVELQACIQDLPATHPTVQFQPSDKPATRHNCARSKQSQGVSVQYNLCNEPWLKYTLAAVADRGLRPSQWTSSRLLDHVLLMETSSKRYQIARITPVASTPTETTKVVYSLAACNAAHPSGVLRKLGLPLSAEHVDSVHEDLLWEEFQWGISSLVVRGLEIPLKRVNFLPCSRATDASAVA